MFFDCSYGLFNDANMFVMTYNSQESRCYKISIFLNLLSPWKAFIPKPLSINHLISFPNLVSISLHPRPLHCCIDISLFFEDFVCRYGLPSTKKKSMSMLSNRWCSNKTGGNWTIGICCCCLGVFLVIFSFSRAMFKPYIVCALLTLSIVTGELLMKSFQMYLMRLEVLGQPKSDWSFLALSAPRYKLLSTEM